MRTWRRRMSAVVHHWALEAATCCKLRALLVRCAERLSSRRLSMAMNVWIGYVMDADGKRSRMSQAMLVASRKTRARAWDGWLGITHRRSFYRRAVQGSHSKLLLRKTRRAFICWMEWSESKRLGRGMNRRSAAKFAKNISDRAWTSWKMACACSRSRRHLLHVATRAVSVLKARLIVQNWRELIWLWQEQRVLVRRSLARLSIRRLRVAFLGFSLATRHSAWRCRIVGLMMRRVALNCLASHFLCWCLWVGDRRGRWIKLRKALIRFSAHLLAASWNKWEMQTRQSRCYRYIAAKVLARIQRRNLLLSWGAWVELTLHQHRQAALVVQLLGRVQNRELSASFHAWRETSLLWKLGRRQLELVCRRLVAHDAAVALHGWQEAVKDVRRNRARVAGFIFKFANQLLSSAFHNWLWKTTQFSSKRALADRALRRILNCHVGVAYFGWAAHCQDLKALRHVAERALARLQRQHLSKAFLAWDSSVREAREQCRLVQRALARMASRLLFASFDCWLAAVDDASHARYRLTRAVHLRKLRMLFAAWKTWLERLKQDKMKWATVQRIVHLRTGRRLSAAWLGWLDWLSTVSRHRWLFSRATTHRIDSCLRTAISAWAQYCQNARWLRVVLARAAGKNMHRVAGHVFAAWQEFRAEKNHKRLVLSRCLSRLSRRYEYAAFDAWATVVQNCRRRMQVLNRALAKLLYRRKATVFAAWLEWASGVRLLKLTAARCLARLMYRCKATAMSAWIQVLDLKKQEKSAVSWGLRRVLNLRLGSAFAAWQCFFSAQARLRSLLAHATAKTTAVKLAAAFAAWSLCLRNRQRLRHLLKRGLTKMAQRDMRAIWLTWVESTAGNKRLKSMVLRSLTRLTQRTKRTCFFTWLAHVEIREKEQGILLRATQFISRNLKWRCFQVWLGIIATKEALVCAIESAFLRHNSSCLLEMSFRAWAAAMCFGHSELARVEQYRKRSAHKTVAAVWFAWLEYAGDLRHRRDVCLSWQAQRSLRLSRRMLVDSWDVWRQRVHSIQTGRAAARMSHAHMRQSMWSLVLHAWAAHLAEIQLARARAATRYCSLRTRLLERAWKGWEHGWRLSIDNLNTAIQAHNRVFVRFVRNLLMKWLEFVSEARYWQRLIQHRTRRLNALRMSAAFGHWQAEVINDQQVKAKQAHANTLSERISSRVLSNALSKWRSFADNLQLRGLALKHMARRRQACVLSAWVAATADSRFKRSQLARTMRHMMKYRLVAAWRAWVNYLARLHHSRMKLRKAEYKLLNKRLSSAWKGWAWITAHERVLHTRLSRLLAWKLFQQLACTWEAWTQMVALQRGTRMKLNRAVARILHGALATTFAAWAERCSVSRTSCRKLHVCLQKLSSRLMADRFATWRHVVVSMNDRRDAASHLSFRMSHRLIIRVFTSWLHWTSGARHRGKLLANAVRRGMYAVVRAAFSKWIEFVAKRAEYHALVANSFVWMRQQKVCRIVGSWRALCTHLKVQRRYADDLLTRAKKHVMHSVVLAWRKEAFESVTRTRTLLRALARLKHRSLALSFAAWLSICRDLQQQRMLSRAIESRIFARLLHASFHGWRQVALTLVYARQRVGIISSRLHKRVAARFFGAWRGQMMMRAMLQAHAEAIMTGLRIRVLALCFASWLGHLHKRHLAKACSARILARMQFQQLSSSYKAWHEFAAARASARHAAAVFMRHRQQQVARLAVRCWAATTWRLARNRAIVRRRVAKIRAKMALAVFVSWHHQTVALREARILAIKALSKAWHVLQAYAFSAWAVVTQRRIRNSTIIMRSTARLQLRNKLAVLKGWSCAVADMSELRSKVARVSLRRHGNLMHKAFDAWVDITSTGLSVVKQLDRAAHFFANRLETLSWRKWCSFVWKQREYRVKLCRALQRRQLHLTCKVFKAWALTTMQARKCAAAALSAWRKASLARAHRRSQLMRFFTRKALDFLRRSFLEWGRTAKRRKLLELLSDTMCANHSKRELVRILVAWRDTAGHFVRLRESLKSAEEAARARLLVLAFQTWRMCTATLCTVRTLVDRKFMMACLTLQRRVWQAWLSNVFDARHRCRLADRAWQMLLKRFQAHVLAAWYQFAKSQLSSRQEPAAPRHDALSPLLSKCFYGWLYLTTGAAPARDVQEPEAHRSNQPLTGPAMQAYQVIPVSTRHVTSPPRNRPPNKAAYFSPLQGPMHYSTTFQASRGTTPDDTAKPFADPEPVASPGPGQPHELVSRAYRSAVGSTARSSAMGNMLHSAYEKVLKECAVLEQKVLELEHQRQLEQVSMELRQGHPQRQNAHSVLDELREENARINFRLSQEAHSNPLFAFTDYENTSVM